MSTNRDPIDGLPVEILGRIFLEGPRLSYPSTVIAGFPYSPILVSKQWRDAALSLSELWSRLIFTSYDEDTFVFHEESLKKWLAMSHSSYLDIVIDVMRYQEAGEKARVAYALDVIGQHCDRWRSLYVGEDSGLIIKSLEMLPQAQNLNFLHIDAPEGSERHYWNGESRPELDMPSLAHLVLTFLTIEFLPRIKSVRLSRLTLLDVKIKANDIKNLSSDFPNVHTMVLGVLRHSSCSWRVNCHQYELSEVEIFSKLRSLQVPNTLLLLHSPKLAPLIKRLAFSSSLESLCYPTPLTDTKFFSNAQASKLVELFLYPTYDISSDFGSWFFDPKVEGDIICTTEKFIKTLKRMPNLRRLGLHPVCTWSRVFKDHNPLTLVFAALSHGEDKICPKLEWIQISRTELIIDDVIRFAHLRNAEGQFEKCLMNFTDCPNIPNLINATIHQLVPAIDTYKSRPGPDLIPEVCYPDYASDQSSPYYRRRPYFV